MKWLLGVFLLCVSVCVFAKPATRVITLTPSLTEMMYAIGASKTLVGVSEGSFYPKSAANLPVVNESGVLNQKEVLSLKPDLIVAIKGITPKRTIAELKKLNLNVVEFDLDQVMSVALIMHKLGVLTGHELSATAQMKRYTEQYTELLYEYMAKPKLRAFFEVKDKPLITAGRLSYINSMLYLCGVRPILPDLPGYFSTVSVDEVLTENPQVIIGVAPVDFKYWLDWGNLAAAKNNAFVVLPRNYILIPGPRLIEGARMLCKRLDAFRTKTKE